MSTYETRTHIGPDGTLIVRAPAEFANSDVRVVVEKGSNGAALSQAEWEAFIDKSAGSIPDFPDVERPGPESFEEREPLD